MLQCLKQPNYQTVTTSVLSLLHIHLHFTFVSNNLPVPLQKHYYKLFLGLFQQKNLSVNLCDIGVVWMAYMRPWAMASHPIRVIKD